MTERCRAETKRGGICKRPALFGTQRCWTHAEPCPVCLDKLGTSDDTAKLQCGHSFHSTCIYKWLERDSRCPMCRTDTKEKQTVTIHYNDDEDLPQEDILEHTMRELLRNRRIRENVWIRRSFVFTNDDGENVAIVDA
ncbi:RING-H2 finger protein [bacterium]|nr:RING-H2 finger protein [bacterium]NBX48691.1 RING-H2 finger protein [bacterium]